MPPDLIHKTQSRLLMLAALFLGLLSLALTISPATRARTLDIDYRWSHWLGYVIWLVGFSLTHRESRRWLPKRDPYIIPLLALLSGWGLLTIWRLTTYFGMRQTIWMALALGIFTLGLRMPHDLNFLRRYKYLWLTGGLIITGFTVLFGTNPLGYGPRLWLGCCGFYMQPSEPLKLLLIIFLAAYFADWQTLLVQRDNSTIPDTQPHEQKTGDQKITEKHNTPGYAPRLQILVPTLIMTGVALILLIVQRDLGTASLFIFIYAVMVYLATGWSWVPLIATLVLASAGGLGYLLFDVVRLRIEAWINPWLDPSGRSYQIVQSLMAVANGGVFGRGPGMGSPTLVPISHSDFIFSAIAEETGLIGVIGLLLLLGLLVHRGFLIAFQTPNTFRRLLAAGLTAFLIGQSLLIISGNMRLLPLTGVTLPFVSYGGSSLMVSFVVLLLLLQVSTQASENKQQSVDHGPAIKKAPLLPITAFMLILISAAALTAGWWAYIRGPDLLTRTDNPRRALDDRYVYRGALLARGDVPLAVTSGMPGAFTRQYNYSPLSPVTGYNHPTYGQSGLEARLDPVLRGLEGNDPATVGWHHLVYGQSPPGLNVRLTLDMSLQNQADDLLNGHSGAVILLNGETGEILVMASQPNFDPNQLDDDWERLVQDPLSPLINRSTQGNYPTGDLAALPFIKAAANPEIERISLRLPLTETDFPEDATPIEVAFAAASLGNAGVRPAARLALSYQSPDREWELFPLLGTAVQLLSPEEVDAQISNLKSDEMPIWEFTTVPEGEELTWYLGGTYNGGGTPITLVLVLEESNLERAEEIGQTLLREAIRE